MRLSILTRKLRSAWRLSGFEKLWFTPVWVLLGVSRLLILAAPFRFLAPCLGGHAGITPCLPVLQPQQEHRAAVIGRAIRLAARYTPWTSNCFAQALTARLLLGVYALPYSLFFGVAREPEEQKLHAHAWVAAGRVRVTGGTGFDHFTVVGCFVSRPR